MATTRKTPARKTAATNKTIVAPVNKAAATTKAVATNSAAPATKSVAKTAVASKAAAPANKAVSTKTVATRAVAPAPHPDKHAEPAVVAAPAKGKRVHGKFAMPKADFALIDELKKLAKKNGQPVRKNDLLRAGLRALRAMDALALRGAIAAVHPVEAPAKAKAARGKSAR